MKIVQVIFAALPLITAPVSAAAANPVTSGPIALNVSLRFGSLAQNYTTTARVVSFAPNYSARIVYAGGRRGFDGTYTHCFYWIRPRHERGFLHERSVKSCGTATCPEPCDQPVQFQPERDALRHSFGQAHDPANI